MPDRREGIKATSHSTIFDIPMRPVREDQRHRRRFTRYRMPATPVMVIIPLNFAPCTLPTHRNREVKSRLNEGRGLWVRPYRYASQIVRSLLPD